MTRTQTDAFEELAAMMPRIADVIKVFEAPEVQARALDALVRTLGYGEHHPEPSTAHHEPQDGKGSSSNDRRTDRSSSDLSIGEFLAESGAVRIVDKIVAIGLFLHDGGAESFTRDDIRAQLETARETLPGNLSRDVNAAISLRYVATRSGSTRDLYVTNTGRAAAESKFAAESRKPMPTKRAARKRAANTNV